MSGIVRSREVCKACGRRGKYEGDSLICVCGKFAADRPEIVIYWAGWMHTLSHDKQGHRFSSAAQARRALEIMRAEIDAEPPTFDPAEWRAPAQNILLWENYLQEYLKDEKRRLLPERQATYSKKKAMSKHLAGLDGRNIRELRTRDVEDFINSPGLREKLSPKSRQDLAQELRFILARAERREDIAKAPIVPSIQVPEGEIRWLGPQEQAAVLEKIPAHHKPIFAFMVTYGPRPAEACALMRDKVDRANGVFHLVRTFSRRQLQDYPKTRKPLSLPIDEVFEIYLEKMPPAPPLSPVFVNSEADPRRNPQGFYTNDALNKIWAAACQAAEVPAVPLYNGVKHSFGMQALNLYGWGIEDLRGWFGHRSEKHVHRYAQANVDRFRVLIKKKKALLKLVEGKKK